MIGIVIALVAGGVAGYYIHAYQTYLAKTATTVEQAVSADVASVAADIKKL